MTSIRVITADRLTPDLAATWSEIQRGNPALDSPFFCPEFTQAVAAVRNDVEIAVLEDGGKPRAFFPFQRYRRGLGIPVGGRLSDFHGVIAAEDYRWEMPELLRGCGLHVWHFHHLIGQKPSDAYRFTTEPSPYLDVAGGFEAYHSDLRQRRSAKSVGGVLYKARKIEREVGPLRFEMHTTDPRVLTQLFAWKRAQYQRTRETDPLSYPWTIALLERVLSDRSAAFAGVLSALYAGEHLAAVHLGLRSHAVFHFWFPTYNQDLAKYSPGQILLLEVAKESQASGIARIDLGKGRSRFKQELMSAATAVAEGCVDCSPTMWSLRRGLRDARVWLRESPFRRVLQWPARLVRRARNHRELR
jgi:CelD/BcsL family acetyltransferase involved in cellulose biosynthesis